MDEHEQLQKEIAALRGEVRRTRRLATFCAAALFILVCLPWLAADIAGWTTGILAFAVNGLGPLVALVVVICAAAFVVSHFAGRARNGNGRKA